MDILALIARIVLVAVFSLSSIAKLRDRPGTHRALGDFGIPSPARRVAGTGLPVIELILAVLLVPHATAPWGALGAVGLFLLFASAIGYQLVHGSNFDCHCFGNFGAGPIGLGTLVRALLLATIALIVVLQSLSSITPVITQVSGAAISVSGVIVVLSASSVILMMLTLWAVVYAYRGLKLQVSFFASQNALQEMEAQGNGSPNTVPSLIGDPAPDLELPDLNGDIVDLASFRGEKLLFVFVKPGCWACEALTPELELWESKGLLTDFRMFVISRGSVQENSHLVGLRSTVLLAPDAHVALAFDVGGTPGAVFVNADGTVGSEAVLGSKSVMALVDPGSNDAHSGSAVLNVRRRALRTTHHLVNALRGGKASI